MIETVIRFFLIGAVLAGVFTLAALQFFPRWNLLDFPERYGLNRHKIPYPGGLVFTTLALLLPIIDWRFTALLIPILILGAVSFYDDRHPLPVMPRLITNVVLASFVFLAGIKITFIGDPFHGTNIQLPFLLSYLFTVVWIIVIQHALNWFDGLKGLCPGVAGLGFLFLGILGLVRPELLFDLQEQPIIWANFFLAGLALGGWWYFFRGKIILGDTGSQVMGFLLATMAIFSGAKIGTTLLVLALPLLDTVAVIFRRMFWDKTSPFKGDAKHLHHHLKRKIGGKNAVLCLLGVSIILGGIGVTFTSFSKLVAVIIAGIGLLSFMLWIHRK